MFPVLPKIVALGEFKPTGAPLFEFEWITRVVSLGQYNLVASVDPAGRNGIALLVHQDLTPSGPPQATVVLDSRILAFRTKIHPDPNIPPVCFVAIYGSSIAQDRTQLQRALTPFLHEFAVFLGDFNAITQFDDAADVTLSYAHKLVWPWLKGLESTGALTDLMRFAHQETPPKTRCRGHAGQTRLDHIFVTKALFPLLSPTHPTTTPLSHNASPLSDHDLISIGIHPWTSSTAPPLRCQGWGAKQIRKFQSLCAAFEPTLQIEAMDPTDFNDG